MVGQRRVCDVGVLRACEIYSTVNYNGLRFIAYGTVLCVWHISLHTTPLPSTHTRSTPVAAGETV